MPASLRACTASVILIALASTTDAAPPAVVTPAPTPAPVAERAAKPLDEARLREAAMLQGERRYREAAAIYEEMMQIQPENAWLVAELANVVADQARAETDQAKRKVLRRRALELALRAEKLGTTNPLTPLIISGTKADGSTTPVSEGAFSKRQEVDRLIHEGEAAFGAHDFAKARECYQKAAELEPMNYTAALWTGDAYFSAREFGPAGEWFRKAIAISPDAETAHRYLGDVLAKLGRREEALNEWIAAVICEPYQRVTRQHFTPQLRAVAEAKKRVIPHFPAMQSKIEGKEVKIAVGPDTGALFLAYNLGAMKWRQESFLARFPKEKALRRSLPEEIEAITVMLTVAKEAGAKDNAAKELGLETWQPIVDRLAALQRDGLLEAYALLERPDAELAKDYAAYRAEHRDKLERYIRTYWCGFD